MHDFADIIILSNGPGELTTWVYPVLRELNKSLDRYQSALNIRISIVLSPCTNASGQEAAIAQNYPGVDRVLAPEHFWQFLLWGKTPASSWEWYDRGAVIFLGGDQIFPVAIGRRLGYATIVYAEWEARWPGWIDYFAVRNETVSARIPARFQYKSEIVGDLMVDRQPDRQVLGDRPSDLSHAAKARQLIVFMPGSKAMKLSQGVPLCLGICDLLHQKVPGVEMAIALAPTISPQYLAKFAQPNSIVTLVEGATADLVESASGYILRTSAGTEVPIHTQFPAHELLLQCQLCITTVGANTAELAALGVPMLVLLPTNQLDAMRSWDGILGLLANLPLVGSLLAKAINRWMLSQIKLAAWPNIWAGEEIVPELLGHLTPTSVTAQICDLLDRPEKLQQMRDRLHAVCGQPGAAARIATMTINALADKVTPCRGQ
jgi:lipid-A-disaccharide synthase